MSGTLQVGGVTLATHTESPSTLTLDSGVVFPAGHIIQTKAVVLAPTNINTSETGFQPVSGLDLTLIRTPNTYVIYILMGGGPFSEAAGRTMHTTVKRSDGTSYTGTNELDLGASSDYGISRLYGENGGVLAPHSGAALDTNNISGSYTYRTFYRSPYGTSVQFSNGDRANTLAVIFEFNPS
jgi:hypothetical protein